MALVRRLTLGIDNTLRIEPFRPQHTGMSETHIPANREIVLGDVSGNTMELVVEIVPQKAREISTCVMRSPEAEEVYRRQILPTGSAAEKQRGTAVLVGCAGDRHFPLFPANRRTRTAAEVVLLELPDGEPMRSRIFVDRSVVQVFANYRQCAAQRVSSSRDDSLGVPVRSQGIDATLRSPDAWQMEHK